MPRALTTIESFSDDLLKAKQTAVKKLLAAGRPLPMLRTMAAASAEPRHNVVGVGIGHKIAKGKVLNRHCVRLYVEKKLPEAVIPRESLLPDEIEGMETDVVETGRFVKLLAAVPMARRRLRPARPGCSVGFRFADHPNWLMAGTLGAVAEANGKRHILSNNHVLANENQLETGSPIFQPGLLDGGDPNRDRIARLTKFVEIRIGVPNRVDCAIAEVDDPRAVRATFLPKVGKLKAGAVVEPAEGMSVHKVGRTTGYTQGTIFDISADVSVEYDMGIAVFQDQILIRGVQGPFSDRGDSGSVIVDRATKRPVALLFAGSSAYTIGNPMSRVLSQLAVAVV